MPSNRHVTPLFIGILVCVPMLALYHFGVILEAARWLGAMLPRFVVLPEAGIHHSKPLQYGYYTLMAFSSAWLCSQLPLTWQKYFYLTVIAFLTFLMTPLLALNGILFEPFSGALAACFAGLMSIMFADESKVSEPAQTPLSQPAKS